jgi:hypothetical protein
LQAPLAGGFQQRLAGRIELVSLRIEIGDATSGAGSTRWPNVARIAPAVNQLSFIAYSSH